MMKKYLLLLGISFALFFPTSGNAAEFYETKYKNPLKNLAEVQEINVAPITFEPNLDLDDFDKLRITAILQKELKQMPLPLNWQTAALPDSPLKESRANLLIHVTKFNRESYETQGYYERSVSYYPTVGYYGGYYSGDRYRKYYRNRRYSGFGIGMVYTPSVSSYYITPKMYNYTDVEIRFTLQDLDEETSYWIYNGTRIENPTRKNISPDNSLEIIAEKAVDGFTKEYKKDLKEWKKIQKNKENKS